MASQPLELHFVLFPFLAQGHLIPMVDIGRLLAQRRGIIVTIITTPINAKRIKTSIDNALESGLQIRVIQLKLPCLESGLEEGCENMDMLPSFAGAINFFEATRKLQQPVEELFEKLKPQPNCLISDMCFPWTENVVQKFKIPKIIFHGFGCFSLLCLHVLSKSKILDDIKSDSEPFLVPGLPDRIELTKSRVSTIFQTKSPRLEDFRDEMREAETAAFGVVVNTFEELESEYVREYCKAKGKKVWCIGPVSLCNENNMDKVARGNKTSIEDNICLKWLDSWESGSVIYVCLGSLSRLATMQMIELGLGLEESNRPFIWVLRHKSDDFEKWIVEERFEQRIKGRSLLIHGWAPQVLILSHPAVGVFLTHCGWNSTLEGIAASVPLITWPLFAEQFSNEKLIVQVLKIGVSVGVEVEVSVGEEEKVGVLVKKDVVKTCINMLMNEGEEAEERRERVKELGKMAKMAVEEGGSSYCNLTMLIQDIIEKTKDGLSSTEQGDGD